MSASTLAFFLRFSPLHLYGKAADFRGFLFENTGRSSCHCFTSKRLAGDQLPGVPEAELARTRNHILIVGSVLVVNCETVVF